MPTHASASAVTDAVAKILREKIRLVCAHTGDRCEHCDELLGSTWKVKDGNIDECAKLIAEAIPLHQHAPEADASFLIVAVDAAIEAIDRGSSSAPILELLRAARTQFLGARAALAAAPPAPLQEEWPCTMARDLLGALKEIIKNDDDAKNAHGKPDANLNGLGLVDLFDCVGHPFGSGEHRQQPYRSVNLEVALTEARAVVAKVESALIAEKDGAKS